MSLIVPFGYIDIKVPLKNKDYAIFLSEKGFYILPVLDLHLQI